jgi:hypothetical protein
MSSQFVIIWCSEGLEGIIPVTEIEKDVVWRCLNGEAAQSTVAQSINFAILRATYNTQRAYEIYGIEADEGIEADTIREMFEDAPQQAAETIRRLGHKIHSDRQNKNRIKIT